MMLFDRLHLIIQINTAKKKAKVESNKSKYTRNSRNKNKSTTKSTHPDDTPVNFFKTQTIKYTLLIHNDKPNKETHDGRIHPLSRQSP